ncbi:hypothetical protein L208DRAFT_1232215, partial [Tricholoma matsutake]
PLEAEKTKAALELHLHVLGCLPHQSTVPPKVAAEDKVPFNQHYLSEAQLQNSVTSSLDDNSGRIQDAKAKVVELSSLSDGMIAANIRHIQECHLLLIFRTVACLVLAKWAPDVLSGDPKSMYNLLHEHIRHLSRSHTGGISQLPPWEHCEQIGERCIISVIFSCDKLTYYYGFVLTYLICKNVNQMPHSFSL